MAEKCNVITAIVLDFETGGLDCQECAAAQISLHAVRLDTFEVMNTLNLYIKPYYRQENVGKPKRKVIRTKYEIEDEAEQGQQFLRYDKAAMDVNGISKDILDNQGVELREVCEQIIQFAIDNRLTSGNTNKPVIVGQNIPFDIGFMQQIMSYAGLYSRFSKVFSGYTDFFGNWQPHYIDTIWLARLAWMHDKGVANYRLGTIASLLGIEVEDAHDADADVAVTVEVLRNFTMRLRNANLEGDANTGVIAHTKRTKMRDHFKI